MRHIEQGHDSEPIIPEALQFTTRQPGGDEIVVDMSTIGGFGDFAFEASSAGEIKRFWAYWTAESAIFIDIMRRLKDQPRDKFVEDMESVQIVLAGLVERGYTPTTEGEGKMNPWMMQWHLSQPHDEPHRYQMFSGGNDSLVVDTGQADGIHLGTDRDMDGEREYKEIIIPNEDIWRFAAGMMARSYDKHGQSYCQLTRFATSQYDQALATCLADLAPDEDFA